MKVYLVETWNKYDSAITHGIFSSYDKAIELVLEWGFIPNEPLNRTDDQFSNIIQNHEERECSFDHPGRRDRARIMEIEVDLVNEEGYY